MKTISSLLALAAAALVAAPAAHAADPFTDAMVAAYAPYRAALFRTNSKAQPESEQAVAQAQQAWRALDERFASRPPAPYDRDAAFAPTLAQVAALYDRAAVEVRERKLAEAHKTLEQARDLMADLRRRNQVVVYSDHMNAYHEVMEHVLIEAPKALAAPQGAGLLLAQTGALEYLARQLRSEAPPALQGDADFMPLLQAVESSVSALKTALLAQDMAAVRDAMGKLKPAYSRMFLKFG